MTEHWSGRFGQEIKIRQDQTAWRALTNVHTCLRRTDQEVSTGAAVTAAFVRTVVSEHWTGRSALAVA